MKKSNLIFIMFLLVITLMIFHNCQRPLHSEYYDNPTCSRLPKFGLTFEEGKCQRYLASTYDYYTTNHTHVNIVSCSDEKCQVSCQSQSLPLACKEDGLGSSNFRSGFVPPLRPRGFHFRLFSNLQDCTSVIAGLPGFYLDEACFPYQMMENNPISENFLKIFNWKPTYNGKIVAAASLMVSWNSVRQLAEVRLFANDDNCLGNSQLVTINSRNCSVIPFTNSTSQRIMVSRTPI